jgi:hypothetical protein
MTVGSMAKLKVLVPLLLAWVLAAGCGATGSDAVKAMSPVERSFLEQKLALIKKDMSQAQVEQILGKPYRGDGTVRPNWLGPEGGNSSQVAVYFFNDKAFKVRWMRIGRFAWNRNL